MKTRELIPIGKIVGAHGLNGTSRVRSYAETDDIYQPNSVIILRNGSGNDAAYKIIWAKPHTKVLLLALKGITNRNQAERLVGCEILLEKDRFPSPEQGTYYWFDLIGLSVYTADGTHLGHIVSVIPTGSNDVYVVKHPEDKSKNELLIPALETVVLAIDLETQIMTVELPEGLLEI